MYLCLIMNVYISISCTCVYTKGSTSNNNNNHPTYPTHSAQQEHKRQLEALQAELQARTEAFDLYRARSHTTLKKVAAGQRGAEDRVVGVQVSVGRVCVCFFFWFFFGFFFGFFRVGWGCGGFGGDGDDWLIVTTHRLVPCRRSWPRRSSGWRARRGSGGGPRRRCR